MKRLAVLLAMISLSPVFGQAGDAGRARRETDVVRVFRGSRDAVVNISTTILMKSAFDEDDLFSFPLPEFFSGPRKAQSLGSGFIIHPDGYIVTNAHVVQRASEVTVSFVDKSTAKAKAIYADTEHDIAVIKIDPAGRQLHTLPLGRGDDLMIGETVIAIGNPLGYQHTITVGVISAIDRELNFSSGQGYRHLIQTDASINPGNSGGPLLNINGELIGINAAIRGDAQNIGFAINVDSLRKILPDLLNPENIRRINLGMRFTSGRGSEIRVVSVDDRSPAQRAGIQAGDLITAFDGKTIHNPIDFYVALVERPVGSRITLTLARGSQAHRATILFETKPKPEGLALARRHLGLVLRELPAKSAAEMGLSDNPLLVVESVLSNSNAHQVGIRRGDILYQLDRYRLESADQLGQILESARKGQQVQAVIVRVRGGFNTIYRVVLNLN